MLAKISNFVLLFFVFSSAYEFDWLRKPSQNTTWRVSLGEQYLPANAFGVTYFATQSGSLISGGAYFNSSMVPTVFLGLRNGSVFTSYDALAERGSSGEIIQTISLNKLPWNLIGVKTENNLTYATLHASYGTLSIQFLVICTPLTGILTSDMPLTPQMLNWRMRVFNFPFQKSDSSLYLLRSLVFVSPSPMRIQKTIGSKVQDFALIDTNSSFAANQLHSIWKSSARCDDHDVSVKVIITNITSQALTNPFLKYVSDIQTGRNKSTLIMQVEIGFRHHEANTIVYDTSVGVGEIEVPLEQDAGGVSSSEIAGIVVGSFVGFAVVFGLVFLLYRRWAKAQQLRERATQFLIAHTTTTPVYYSLKE